MQEIQPLWRFTSHAWLPLAGFILTLGLGLSIWSRKPGSLPHQAFAVLNVAAALWNLDVFLLFTLRDGELAGAVDRILQIPIVSIPFLGLFFLFVFLGRSTFHPLIVAFGIWTLALWCISSSPGFISGWERHWFGYYGRAGRLYSLFVATHLAYLVFSCRFLWKELRATRDHLRRNQITYLLAANLVLGLLSLDNFSPLYGFSRLPVGILAPVMYFFVMAVTIVRYRLLDVQLLFRYGLLYSSLTFVLSSLYLFLIVGLQGWFHMEVFTGSLISPMLPALAVAFAFGPVKNSLQKRLDRHFFRSRHAMRSRLSGFAAAVTGLLSEEDVWKAAWEKGWKHVDPDKAVVAVGTNGCWLPAVTFGEVPAADDFAAFAKETAQDGEGHADTTAVFERAVSVAGREGVMAYCLLGRKRSGAIYTAEDIAFLEGIAGQTALAVDRARLIAKSRRKEHLAAMGKTAAVVSHELRNPLSIIRGAAALLRSRVEGEDCLTLLAVVDDEVRRGDHFIGDFLYACREPQPLLRPIDLGALLRGLFGSPAGGAFDSGNLSLDLPLEPVRILGDSFQLERVFQNLARNSTEAAGAGCTISIRCEATRDRWALVTVADDGPGIEESRLHSIFEPFQTTKNKGTGLGLTIVMAIVEAHRGRIRAENGQEGGAVFRIWFPAAGCSPAGGVVEGLAATRDDVHGGEVL